MFTSQEQRAAPSCVQCGRSLGVGFYYSCHVCGATYCYAHSPQRCEHRRAVSLPDKMPSLSKA